MLGWVRASRRGAQLDIAADLEDPGVRRSSAQRIGRSRRGRFHVAGDA
jgi:hypothetical protein